MVLTARVDVVVQHAECHFSFVCAEVNVREIFAEQLIHGDTVEFGIRMITYSVNEG